MLVAATNASKSDAGDYDHDGEDGAAAPPSSDEEGEEHDEEGEAKHAQQEIITILGRTLGRRGGDARMHKAVAARLENPTITLMEALVRGGFRFPTTDCNEDKKVASSLLGSNDRKVLVDEDGVQLCQRKNQLSRRLRIIRKKEGNDTGRITTMSADNFHEQRDSGGATTTGTSRRTSVPNLSAHPPEHNGIGQPLTRHKMSSNASVSINSIRPTQQFLDADAADKIGTRNDRQLASNRTSSIPESEQILLQQIMLEQQRVNNNFSGQQPTVLSSSMIQRNKRSFEEMSGDSSLVNFLIKDLQNRQQQQLLSEATRSTDVSDKRGLPANSFGSSNYALNPMYQEATPFAQHGGAIAMTDQLESLGNRSGYFNDDAMKITELLKLEQPKSSLQSSLKGQQKSAFQQSLLRPLPPLQNPSALGGGCSYHDLLMFGRATASSSRRGAVNSADTATTSPSTSNITGSSNVLLSEGLFLSSSNANLSLAAEIYTQQRRGQIVNCLKAAGLPATDGVNDEVTDALIRAFEMKLMSLNDAQKSPAAGFFLK